MGISVGTCVGTDVGVLVGVVVLSPVEQAVMVTTMDKISIVDNSFFICHSSFVNIDIILQLSCPFV